jgi:hypothetical protein
MNKASAANEVLKYTSPMKVYSPPATAAVVA